MKHFISEKTIPNSTETLIMSRNKQPLNLSEGLENDAVCKII